jgi:uncharacterized protein (TIGR03435 family)
MPGVSNCLTRAGGPKWIDSERFDIVAKANPPDHLMKYSEFVPMVQALLESRFKLVMHRETKTKAVMALVVGDSPAKIRVSQEGEQTGIQRDNGEIAFRAMSMAGFVNTLSNVLHFPVVDHTGLTGSFDFKVVLASEQTNGTSQQAEGAGDLLSKAVEEQLGFRFQRQKADFEITIVDHAEHPTEN